jgi:hypothetical protein
MSFKELFKHRHHWRQMGTVFHSSEVNPLSVCAATAKIMQCSCGAEERLLTPAGKHQVACGDDLAKVLGVYRMV